jgi:predicted double-glycine peptidase
MRKQSLVLSLLLTLLNASPSAHAGTVMISGASGGNLAVNVTSQKEARFQTVLEQQYDFSCGSASLATLLTFHYADPVSEEEIFKSMYDTGDKEKIQREGFSLLDIKNYLSRRGYKSDGFKTSLDKLQEIGIPAIVLIDQKGYAHFVVVKGVTANEVLLGDPSRGVRRVDRTEFESMWGGLLFLIRSNIQVANQHFNQEDEWAINPRPPLHLALERQELSNITLMLPGANDF